MLDGTKSLVEWPSEIMLTERPGRSFTLPLEIRKASASHPSVYESQI